MTVCPSCDKEVNEDSKFCIFCRGLLSGQDSSGSLSAPTFTQDLDAQTIAYRVNAKDLRGLINKTLVVHEGQQALLFKDGRLDTTLGVGSHPMGNMLVSRMRDNDIVLFKTGDFPLDITIPRLLSNDPLPLAMDFRLTFSVQEPTNFLRNLMAGGDVYETSNLTASLYPLVEEGCQAFASHRSVRDLANGGPVLKELELSMASHLDQSLSRWGLRQVSCQAVNIRCEAWDDLTQTRTEYFVAASEEQVALEGRKLLFDVQDNLDLQILAEETASMVNVEKKAALWERMRQALLADAQGKIRSRSELEEMVRQADLDHVLKEDEYASLVATLSEAKEDHQKAREFLIRRVESEGEYELRKLDLTHQFGLSEERLSLELASSRQEMDGLWELQLRRLDLRIEQRRRLAQFQREQSDQDTQQEDNRRLGSTTTAAAIADIERDQDDKDVRAALAWHAQYKAQQRQHVRERQEDDLENERKRMETQLKTEETNLKNRLTEKRQQHDHELKRIGALSNVGIETLIAVSGAEQGMILGQLARTRALSGCTPEQIMAMQAHKSPQVADALKEVLTAAAAGGQLDQYERLIGELKDAGRISREDHQANMATLAEMFNKALDSVRDTAVAFSSAPRPENAEASRIMAPDMPEGTVTLLFSDIVDSAVMTERLGDQGAQEILHLHNDLIRKAVSDHGGTEVKSMGDGFMLAFPGGRDAILCAVSIQRALGGLNTSRSAWDLKVRAGLHSGEMIKEANDYFGRNVILAARIAAKAKGGQILVSSLLKEITESAGDFEYGDELEVKLKGLDGTSRVFPVTWRRIPT